MHEWVEMEMASPDGDVARRDCGSGMASGS
jgi:hypothetical protein